MKIHRLGRARFAVFVWMALASGAVTGQPYPAKPIRVIVSAPAGGGVDTMMRLIAPKLQESLGQLLIIDPRPGAGGNLGAAMVAKAEPDGYTLLAVFSSFASNVSLYTQPGFDTITDFAPVAMIDDR